MASPADVLDKSSSTIPLPQRKAQARALGAILSALKWVGSWLKAELGADSNEVSDLAKVVRAIEARRRSA